MIAWNMAFRNAVSRRTLIVICGSAALGAATVLAPPPVLAGPPASSFEAPAAPNAPQTEQAAPHLARSDAPAVADSRAPQAPRLVLAADGGASTVSSSLAAGGRGLRYDCLIEPRETIELSSEATGVVAEVLVDRGDAVSKGQPLARLTSGVQRAELEIAKARAAAVGDLEGRRAQAQYERRRLARHDRAIRAGAVTGQQADEIRTALEVAEAAVKTAEEDGERLRQEVARAEARLAAREIRSTIDGVVLTRNLSPGESVEGEPLFTLVALDPLHVEVFLPVALWERLATGGAAEIYAGGRDQPLTATIDVIDPVADAASSTFKARLTLPNPDLKVMAGLKCGAAFPAAR